MRFGDEGKVCFLGQLDATVEAKGEDGEVTLAFAFHGPVLDQAIAERGDMPLPPYIASRRAPDEHDRTDYQTMFAQRGSVAAPTAGLHFTDDLVARLAERGIALAQGDAACRRRHLSAGQGGRTPATTACTRSGEASSAQTADALNEVRRAGRAHRRRRLDGAAAARKRKPARTA